MRKTRSGIMHISVYLYLFLPCCCLTYNQLQAASLFPGQSILYEQSDDSVSYDYIPLKIGGFNIQVFGTKKMSRKDVKDILVKIILRYDILLVQEIRSTTDKAINDLLKAVNSASDPQDIYAMKLSERLGRSSSKEQYAFLYRKDRAEATDSYVYTEIAEKDVFQREPYIVKFRTPNAYLKEFALAGIHTQPSNAPSEIDHLVDVYDNIVERLKIRDVMILGDFNAGCSYVTTSEWKQIRLATDHRFYWLFTNDVDTTVSNSDCPYDRMVVAGEGMRKAVVPKSERVYNFAKAFDLTPKEAALVSDHWVIEAQLKDKSYLIEEKHSKSKIRLTVIDEQNVGFSKRLIYLMRSKNNPLLQTAFSSITSYTKTGSIAGISLTTKVDSIKRARLAVKVLHTNLPKLLVDYQVIIATRKLDDFVSKIGKACKIEKSKANEFEYQVVSDGSCSHDFKIDSVTLTCSTSKLRCQLDFLFV